MYSIVEDITKNSKYKNFEVLNAFSDNVLKSKKDLIVIERINILPSGFSDNKTDEYLESAYITFVSDKPITDDLIWFYLDELEENGIDVNSIQGKRRMDTRYLTNILVRKTIRRS